MNQDRTESYTPHSHEFRAFVDQSIAIDHVPLGLGFKIVHAEEPGVIGRLVHRAHHVLTVSDKTIDEIRWTGSACLIEEEKFTIAFEKDLADPILSIGKCLPLVARSLSFSRDPFPVEITGAPNAVEPDEPAWKNGFGNVILDETVLDRRIRESAPCLQESREKLLRAEVHGAGREHASRSIA